MPDRVHTSEVEGDRAEAQAWQRAYQAFVGREDAARFAVEFSAIAREYRAAIAALAAARAPEETR